MNCFLKVLLDLPSHLPQGSSLLPTNVPGEASSEVNGAITHSLMSFMDTEWKVSVGAVLEYSWQC